MTEDSIGLGEVEQEVVKDNNNDCNHRICDTKEEVEVGAGGLLLLDSIGIGGE